MPKNTIQDRSYDRGYGRSSTETLLKDLNRRRVPPTSETARRDPRSKFLNAGPTQAIQDRGGVIPILRPSRKETTRNLIYDRNIKPKKIKYRLS